MALTLLKLNDSNRADIQASANTLTLDQITRDAEMFIGLKSATGKTVDANTAIRASGVLACIRILLEDVAAPPLILKRNTPDGPQEATDHPLYKLLKIAPNPFQTSVEVREHMMMDALLFGKWAHWAERDPNNGKLIAIHPLLADRLTWAGQLPNGDLQWNYSSQYLNRTFTQQDLWRGNIMSRTTFEGQSLIILAREAIGLALAAEEQGARLFSNGIQTNMVVTSPDTLKDNEREQLKQSLRDTYSGSANAYKSVLLEGGLKMERIGLTAEESQYNATRNYQLADIARIFRIPSVMLGIVGDKANTYASTEQFFLSYEKHCLRPWCNRIEQTISRDLILNSESTLYAKHDLTDLLRADMKTRYDAYAVGINGGFIKPNEPRTWEGLPSDPRLNTFYRPLNSVSVDAPQTPAPAPGDQKPPQNDPKTAPEAPKPGKNAPARLAGMAAVGVVDKERKWFDMQDAGKATAGQLAKFPELHTDLVLQVTGATVEDVADYCQWRVNNKQEDAEAKQKLIKLCLEAHCEA